MGALHGANMHRLAVAAAVAAFTSPYFISAASAADLPMKAPAYKAPIALTSSWTGFYVGINAGGAWGDRSVDFAPNDLTAAGFTGPLPSVSFTSSGVIGGVQLGYNWQFNSNWLIGIETDFDGAGIKGSSTSSINGGLAFTSTVDEHVKWLGTVRGRLGYLPTGNLLAYVTGGFAYGSVEHTGSFSNPSGITIIALGNPSVVCAANSTCFAGSSSGVATGWTLGGGLEYALWRNLTLRGEYLYVSLDSKSVTETAVAFLAGTAPASFNASYNRTNINIARIGLSYRF